MHKIRQDYYDADASKIAATQPTPKASSCVVDHALALKQHIIKPAPRQPLYEKRVLLLLAIELKKYRFAGKIDRIDLLVGIEHGRKTPRTNWKEVQKLAFDVIGETAYVESRPLLAETEYSCSRFLVRVQDPTGSMLQKLQIAIRDTFGSDSWIGLDEMEVAVDVFPLAKFRNSVSMDKAFTLLNAGFLPPYSPDRWNPRGFGSSGPVKFLHTDGDTTSYPKEYTRYWLNKDDPVFYKLYTKVADGITIKGDPTSGRVLSEAEQCIRMEATFRQEALQEELGLETLDDLLDKGLPNLKHHFRFMGLTPKDWRGHTNPMVGKYRAAVAHIELTDCLEFGLWKRAFIELDREPSLVELKKHRYASNEELDERFRAALRGINKKMKIGSYLKGS